MLHGSVDQGTNDRDTTLVGGVIVGLLAGVTLGGVLVLALGLTGAAGFFVMCGSSLGLAGGVFLASTLAVGRVDARRSWR